MWDSYATRLKDLIHIAEILKRLVQLEYLCISLFIVAVVFNVNFIRRFSGGSSLQIELDGTRGHNV